MRKSVCVSVFEQRTGTPEKHNDLCLILCDDMYCMWWHLKARTRLLFFRCKSDAVVVVVAADVRVEEALCIVEHICDKIVHTREPHRTNTFSIALFRSMLASPLVRSLAACYGCKYCEFRQTNIDRIVRLSVLRTHTLGVPIVIHPSIWFHMRLYWNPVVRTAVVTLSSCYRTT